MARPTLQDPQRDAAIVAALAAGQDMAAIADEHGVSLARVRQIQRREETLPETFRAHRSPLMAWITAKAQARTHDRRKNFVRAAAVLRLQGIATLEDLLGWTRDELMLLPNAGKATAAVVETLLAEDGLQLAQRPPRSWRELPNASGTDW